MRRTHLLILCLGICILSRSLFSGEAPVLNQRPAGPGDWGYRPENGAACRVNPPSFSWRPQRNVTWEIQCSRDEDFRDIYYRVSGLEINVHCPPRTFKPGTYRWRYTAKGPNGKYTNFSNVRTFTIAKDAASMPLPPREELLSRIPDSHPRLFLRPEGLKRLRALARGRMRSRYRRLLSKCKKILANPPSTEEPPTYPKGIARGSDPWRKIWWGNRRQVIKTLNGAATLGFGHLLGGKKEYALEAKRILLECAQWDPKGSTGYRYNDEAGMPYAYYFSRTYTFVNGLLSEKEKELCRSVMKVRGREMYNHLYPRHFWRPYGSHRNRAWHFLGEVGIAFYNEIEEAADWVWFAANVFFNVYPVWSDSDGGWHEGFSYWLSYQNRFTWWADVMREALKINAYNKPYYSQVGYYAMYLMPPHKRGGGFGDLTARDTSSDGAHLMTTFATQAQNGHWMWWVEKAGGPKTASGYIGFIRGSLEEVAPVPPAGLPESRLFYGTGQAYLNTTLTDARKGVQIAFKSSPFGTQSHGYEANNSFLVSGYGKRLLIRSGRRDSYGSKHHRGWMWSTRSVNNITVNGVGQIKRDPRAKGRIVAFSTTEELDIVSGEAAGAYRKQATGGGAKVSPLARFRRTLMFAKPELLVVYDRLEARMPSNFEYWLHSINSFNVKGQSSIRTKNGNVVCDIEFLEPDRLSFSQTNQYDPNPRPRVKLREWHLTAKTALKQKKIQFVAVYRIHRSGKPVPKESSLVKIPGGCVLEIKRKGGTFTALLPTDDSVKLKAEGFTTKGQVKVKLKGKGGKVRLFKGEPPER